MKKQRKNNTEKMKNQKISWLAKAVYAAAAILAVAPTANAMHIMEGYLPPAFCIAWGIVCLPFLVFGFRSLNRRVKENRRSITLIAMAGAFVFVLSSLKIPSVTGSCSHMTGTGLGAILFGPCAVSVLGIIVLIFQAVLLAHGGLTTLGANCFSMAITGPILSWLIYKGLSKTRINRRITVFSCRITWRFVYLLRNQCAACTCLSVCTGWGNSICCKISRYICTDTASAGSDRRNSYRCCCDRTGEFCKK